MPKEPIGPPLPNNHCAWFDRWTLAESADRIVVSSRSVKKRKLNPWVLAIVVVVSAALALLAWELASPEVSIVRLIIAAVPAALLLAFGLSYVNRIGASTDPARGIWELDGVGYEVRRNGLSIGLFENVKKVLIAAPPGETEAYVVVLLEDGTQLGLGEQGSDTALTGLTAARKLAKFLGCSVEKA